MEVVDDLDADNEVASIMEAVPASPFRVPAPKRHSAAPAADDVAKPKTPRLGDSNERPTPSPSTRLAQALQVATLDSTPRRVSVPVRAPLRDNSGAIPLTNHSGTDCFANAVINAFIALPSFTADLASLDHAGNVPLTGLLAISRREADNVSVIRGATDLFPLGRQHDSVEFAEYLLGQLQGPLESLRVSTVICLFE